MKERELFNLQQVLQKLNIESLNSMQAAAVEHCAKNNSMVLLSPTGTGKTLAYLLPLLQRLNIGSSSVEAVIVVPTRELARQVAQVWRSMDTGCRMTALYGGRPVIEEAALLQNTSANVIVGTPGRLVDHLKQGNFLVDECRLLVIDEFDKCLEMGFQEEMQQLLELLPNVDSRFLLSATDCEEIPAFAAADGAGRLDFRADNEQPLQRTQFYKITTTPDDRLQVLFNLLCAIGGEPAIVFCNFRETVEEVRSYLAKGKLIVSAYHGALEQKDRELALYRFSSGCSNILVSTDLAARGLDIKDVRHVIHFQRPMSADIFTHRNGRTARWDAEGAVYMISYHDHPLPDFVPEEIQEYRLRAKYPLPALPDRMALYIGKGKRDKISRGDIAGFFMKKGGLRPEEIGAIAVFDRYSYVAVQRSKGRSLPGLLSGEKIKGVKTVIEPVRG
ncbi:MAG: DEAD/DEAH box helicase [Bacteroidaceae bacterium]|nr:DEAD/DEAH box helicase [Bacteroidaceae bacterium]